MSKTLFAIRSFTVTAFAMTSAMALYGQNFTGFAPGNLVVSRTVYTGTNSVLAVGQPLPPVCPSTAACGKAKATDNGAYPSTTSTGNVFNNNVVDGSFGITSPIILDQMTPSGTIVNTLPVPSSMVNTSFSSKSELALNLSADGTSLTFMAYVAPPNTVDVSNANTPGAFDPTNPAGGSYYRAVVQVGPLGSIQVTPTNSYSGNNGRAAALANGLYYMVGNSNNGTANPANVIATAGVQMATPGQTFETPAVPVGDFSIDQVINPATGNLYPPDKVGKDNNFRGLTVFNNTLYVTKGSGSNGFNTVYRVGDLGSLPTLANAASAAVTILPGFPNTLAKAAGAANPFGLFFANATTLYVADEGDGVAADAITSTIAGLQKWTLANGTWTRQYVLQNGLNLGKPYSVAGYPTSLNPAADGLRNIAGKVNGDGTVTIWGITSTISANGDQGADPNQLVMITDTLAATTLPASEQFTILRTANAGELLRGVCLAPVAPAPPVANVPLILSAANPSAFAIAPGSLATANGINVGAGTQQATAPFPTQLSGETVSIVDGNGITTLAPILNMTPAQVTFLVPAAVAPGTAQITVANVLGTQTASNVQIAAFAPGILTMNGEGLPAGQVIQVAANGAQTAVPLYKTDSNGAVVQNTIPVPPAGGSNYLELFGTGLAKANGLTVATINGVSATVVYAGPAGADSGLDQVNMLIPKTLAGAGYVNVQLGVQNSTSVNINANPVQITLQ